MNIKILRARKLPTHTIGQLYVNDEFFCFTLEDVVREVGNQPVERWKVFGETAIPAGRYNVSFEQSARFGTDTITINNVPGFSHIRIHSGNTAKDTEGCIIVGYKLTADNIIQPGTTRPALADLKSILKRANEEIYLSIV